MVAGHGLPLFLEAAVGLEALGPGRDPHRDLQGHAHRLTSRPVAEAHFFPGDFLARKQQSQGCMAQGHQLPHPQKALGQGDFLEKIDLPGPFRHLGRVGQAHLAQNSGGFRGPDRY